MGIVWSIIFTAFGGLIVLWLGFMLLALFMVVRRTDRGAQNSFALSFGASITMLLYAGLIGVVITSCWFPELYLQYTRPYVWWILGIFIVSFLVGRMLGGVLPKGIRGIAGTIPGFRSNFIARTLPIIALDALSLIAFIMVWIAPFCIQ